MIIWLLRKHPPLPFRSQRGHLEAFTIDGVFPNRPRAKEAADEKNKRASKYLYTIKRFEIKEGNHG